MRSGSKTGKLARGGRGRLSWKRGQSLPSGCGGQKTLTGHREQEPTSRKTNAASGPRNRGMDSRESRFLSSGQGPSNPPAQKPVTKEGTLEQPERWRCQQSTSEAPTCGRKAFAHLTTHTRAHRHTPPSLMMPKQAGHGDTQPDLRGLFPVTRLLWADFHFPGQFIWEKGAFIVSIL